ncbi:hypothetical protein NDA07_10390 [Microcoleus vaginatus DQ-U2]|uniref:hypothetical protein n=1 Tax=Microcoleus vaginatus TaxID=119532 RepID=UPI001682FB20|nr:hypothetical protein [Microcoleus sp. FACHB-DQ6]
MKIEDYPLAKKLILDAEGNITQVILDYTDYQYFLEAIEDRGLLLAMREVKNEKPLNLRQALAELETEGK